MNTATQSPADFVIRLGLWHHVSQAACLSEPAHAAAAIRKVQLDSVTKGRTSILDPP